MANYQAFSCRCRGYSHRDGVCQDFSGFFEEPEGSLRIAVVSDGHGDKSCFRSDVGSRMAVETALEDLKIFARDLRRQGWVSRLGEKKAREALMARLKGCIVADWYDRVESHLRENPLTKEDLDREHRRSELYRRGKSLHNIYGCTLIAAMIVDGWLVVLHVGDGRCVVLHADGTADQPVPWDDQCVGNVTTSLCHSDAHLRCRHYVCSLEADPIAACFVTTDGIEDCFSDLPEQNGLCAYFCDVASRLAREGIGELEKEMEEELPALSQYGSQDDMSFSALVDLEALQGMQGKLDRVFETYKCLLEAGNARKKLNSMQRKMDYLRSNVAQAERLAEEAGIQSAAAEEALLEAERELAWETESFEERFSRKLQEAEEKISAWLNSLLQGARQKLESCRRRQEESLRSREEAEEKLEKARQALADYSAQRQSWVDQLNAAEARIAALRSPEAEEARPEPEEADAPADTCPEPEEPETGDWEAPRASLTIQPTEETESGEEA